MLDSQTTMYGLFGDPVGHSKSPLMQNAAFRAAGINAAYAAFRVAKEDLAKAVAGIRALGFGGVNVTIPHKVDIMQYLDEIDEGARRIGAVNTVVNRGGRLIGYNTDGIGYVRSLKEETGLRLAGARILIIGAGGAARGVAFALADERPDRIVIANRTEARAAELAEAVQQAAGHKTKLTAMGTEALMRVGREPFDLVINTTSIGMHPNTEETPIGESVLERIAGAGAVVSDLIYNPRETRLLALAKQLGAAVHGGLGMFVYQGAYAFEYWTGIPAPAEIMRETVENSLNQTTEK